MKFAGKSLNEYFVASKKFLAIIFTVMVIIVVLRLSHHYPPGIQIPLGLLAVIVIGWGGWATVRDYGFNLKQVGFVGFLLSFGTHWALLILHSPWEVLYFFLVNSILYVVIAAFGGWLAKKFKKFPNLSKATSQTRLSKQISDH